MEDLAGERKEKGERAVRCGSKEGSTEAQRRLNGREGAGHGFSSGSGRSWTPYSSTSPICIRTRTSCNSIWLGQGVCHSDSFSLAGSLSC